MKETARIRNPPPPVNHIKTEASYETIDSSNISQKVVSPSEKIINETELNFTSMDSTVYSGLYINDTDIEQKDYKSYCRNMHQRQYKNAKKDILNNLTKVESTNGRAHLSYKQFAKLLAEDGYVRNAQILNYIKMLLTSDKLSTQMYLLSIANKLLKCDDEKRLYMRYVRLVTSIIVRLYDNKEKRRYLKRMADFGLIPDDLPIAQSLRSNIIAMIQKLPYSAQRYLLKYYLPGYIVDMVPNTLISVLGTIMSLIQSEGGIILVLIILCIGAISGILFDKMYSLIQEYFTRLLTAGGLKHPFRPCVDTNLDDDEYAGVAQSEMDLVQFLFRNLYTGHPNTPINIGTILKLLSETARNFNNLTMNVPKFLEMLSTVAKNTGLIHDRDGNMKAAISSWIEAVAQEYNNFGLFKAGHEYDTHLRIVDLMKQGMALNKYFVTNKTNLNIPSFQQAYRTCQEMSRETTAFAVTSQIRPEPLVIYIVGKTGHGKSLLAQLIPHDLFGRLNIPYNADVDFYRRNESQDHWDGYNHQKVVCFDDIFQSKDPQDLKISALEFLHLKNELPYPLKMADLNAKANTWFTSPLVLITSNTDIVGNTPVVSIGAIRRRRDIFVELSINDSFCENGLANYEKISMYSVEKYGDIRICPELYDFKLFSSGSEDTAPTYLKTLSYDEFLSLAEAKWHGLHSKSSLVDNYLKGKVPTKNCDVGEDDMPMHTYTFKQRCKSYYQSFKMGCSNIWFLFNLLFSSLKDRLVHKIKTNDNNIRFTLAATGITTALGFLVYMLYKNKEKSTAEMDVSGDEQTRKTTKPVVKTDKGKSFRRVFNKAEIEQSGDNVVTTRKRVIMKTSNNKYTTVIKSEGTSDQNAMDVAYNALSKSMVTVLYMGGKMHGTMLTDRLLMCPSHLFDHIDEIDPNWVNVISIDQPIFGMITYELSKCDLIIKDDADLAFLLLPKKQPRYPSIVNQFIKEQDLSVNMKEVMLIMNSSMGDKAVFRMINTSQPKTHKRIKYDNESISGYIYQHVIARAISYTANTKSGDCGALLVGLNAQVPRKLYGFHVSALLNRGYSAIVTQEMIREVMDMFGVYDIVLDIPIAQGASNINFPSDRISVCGILDKKDTPHIPSSTTIVKSCFYDKYVKAQTAPSYMRYDMDINPFYINYDKWAPNIITFEDEILDTAVQSYTNHVMSLPSEYKTNPRVLTLEEVLNGVPGDESLLPIKVSTSAGYPYSLDTKHKGKSGLIHTVVLPNGENHYEPTPEFEADIIQLEAELRDRKISNLLIYDILKDERRPIEKVKSKKTRIFNVSPCTLNILLKKYCGSFISHLYANHIEGECSIGINAHSQEWHQMVEHLLSKGENLIAGDYSCFDKNLSWQVIEQCADVIKTFYRTDDPIYDALFVATFQTYRCVGNTVYMPGRGNTSGNTLTTIVNSMVNSIYVRCIFYELQRKQLGCIRASDFDDYVTTKNYGDDNLIAVADTIPWFDMVSIKRAFAKHGIDYTSADKSDEEYSYKTIYDVTYLKRGFVAHKGITLAPLKLDGIREVLLWARKNETDSDMIPRYRSVIQELVHHGEQVFKSEKAVIDRLFYEQDLSIPTMVYRDIYQDMFHS